MQHHMRTLKITYFCFAAADYGAANFLLADRSYSSRQYHLL